MIEPTVEPTAASAAKPKQSRRRVKVTASHTAAGGNGAQVDFGLSPRGDLVAVLRTNGGAGAGNGAQRNIILDIADAALLGEALVAQHASGLPVDSLVRQITGAVAHLESLGAAGRLELTERIRLHREAAAAHQLALERALGEVAVARDALARQMAKLDGLPV
jgi:hypothetical protein